MRPVGGRRHRNDSFIPPATPLEFQQRQQHFPRESDASFASSRPSSVGGGGGGRTRFEDYKDRHYQQQVVSTINSFLSSQNFPISFKSTTPSAKDILETLRFLLSLIDFPSSKLEDDLPPLLKRLNYPFKLNRSILKSPAAPHQWPSFLALIHWLVQIASFNLHLSDSTSNTSTLSSILSRNFFHRYTFDTYVHFLKGDDDRVEELDREIMEKLCDQKALAEKKLDATNNELKNLRDELERLRSQPLQKEELEETKGVLENDVKKFNLLIEDVGRKIEETEKVLAEKERALEAKEQENCRLCEENEELRRRVEAQPVNARDVERMKRELQALERDAGEAELARNAWEDKSWELDTTLAHKFKDLEALALDCNQELRRLKIGDGIQYQLNPKGSVPAEVMGFDHKLTLKPALNSFSEDIKKSSMGRWEESISYQKKSNENAIKLEEKRNHLAAVQSRIDQVEAQLNMIKKETEEYSSRCSAEAKQILEDVQQEGHQLEIMQREAAQVLKTTKLKLQEGIKQSEEAIQMHARELFKLVDSVSKYKEHVGSKISEMKRELSETASTVSEAYRGSFPPPPNLVIYSAPCRFDCTN